MASSSPSKVFFREILEGDLKKQMAKSNQAKSGGGARDLRLPAQLHSYLEPFFRLTRPNFRTAEVFWEEDDDPQTKTATLELWRPTKARPNEIRIASIDKLDIWRIDNLLDFNRDRASNSKWYYLLILDTRGRVWAHVMQASHLPYSDFEFRSAIASQIEKSRKRTICGIFDYATGGVVP